MIQLFSNLQPIKLVLTKNLINMKRFRLFLSIIAIAIIGFGCEKDNSLSVSQKNIESVYSKNGILVFEDWQSVYSTLNLLKNMNTHQIFEWEKSHNFQSVASILNIGIEEDKKLFAKYQKEYTKEELMYLSKTNSIQKLSNYTMSQIELGVLKVVKAKDNSEYVDINCNVPHYAYVLNKDHIFVVNDTIYKFEEQKLKLITSGDFEKISLLSSVEGSTDDIIVAHGNNLLKTGGWSYLLYDDEDQENYRKARLSANGRRWTDGCYSKTDYWISVQCWRDHWWNGWIYDEMSISGDGGYRWRQRKPGSSQVQTWQKYIDFSGSYASYTFVTDAPYDGVNYDCRPLDPFYLDMGVRAQGGGVTLNLAVDHNYGLGY